MKNWKAYILINVAVATVVVMAVAVQNTLAVTVAATNH